MYYPVSVTGPLIARDLGLTPGAVYGAYSALLIASALVAPIVGRAIDRHGGRPVLSAGAVVASLGLAAASSARGLPSYALCSLLLGVAAAMTLYDAAFPALVEATHPQGRRAITYVTFVGGFASTLSWPVTAFLAARIGWRDTYLAYAAVMALVCLPAALLSLPRRRVGGSLAPAAAHGSGEAILTGRARRRAFLLFGCAVTANQFVASGFLIHLIAFARHAGIAESWAIVLGMVFGPSQVLGRLGEMLAGARFSALATGRFAMACLPAGLVVLTTFPTTFPTVALFVAALGVSNGLVTIARGTVTLALFGPVGYGARMGRLTVPTLAARAAGPFAFALAIEHWGVEPTMLLGLALATVAVLAMEAVAAIERGARSVRPETVQ